MSFHPLPVRSRLLLAAMAGTCVLLGACSRDQPEAEVEAPPPAATPVVAPPDSVPAADISGFTPLPTTNQVLAANSNGRSDPVASDRPVPVRPAAGATPAAGRGRPAPPPPLQLPPGFLFSGVIRVGASPRAMVQFGANSGAVGIGERGGRNTDLLPAGWVVSSIDVDRGRLVLRQGAQTVTADL